MYQWNDQNTIRPGVTEARGDIDEILRDFLVNAQGEDVVAGIRQTEPIGDIGKWNKGIEKQLKQVKKTLEQHYTDMQDLEFTVERGQLFMLQTRTGKRTGAAAVKIACDMVREKLIDEKTAVLRIPPGDLSQLLLPSFNPAAKAFCKTKRVCA